MKKILIANRGEIAVRIIRTCREMGVASIAVYSECDRTALHVRLADEAHAIGPDRASESYLRIDKLIDAARKSRADGVHPGYGFLAENPEFADACRKAGLVFIGPSVKAMTTMGSKTAARQMAIAAGIPVVPGTDAISGTVSDADIAKAATEIGFPLLVKAVAGGGGKGMRIVRSESDLAGGVQMARSEAQSAFGSDEVYLERLLGHPRHIEVQLLGDEHGSIWPFVERECSIQRRHQKLVEETPSPSVSPDLRWQLVQAAAAVGKAARYSSAGTVEFLVDDDGHFYFLEMNTRLQVEHPITEMVTGIDFVKSQIEIARGRTLADAAGQDAADAATGGFIAARGHAIECRVYAEDVDGGFIPSPGAITHLRAPAGPGIRDDNGAIAGSIVPTHYDPLVSKVIAWAPDRRGAISRMLRALNEYDVRGIKTTIGFCRELLSSHLFRDGEFDTTTVDRLMERRMPGGVDVPELEELAAIASAFAADAEAEPPSAVEPAATETAVEVPKPVPQMKTVPESLWAQRARLENLRQG